MISNESSRMYAALRCIEEELKKSKPSIKHIKEIIAECSRDYRPINRIEQTFGSVAHPGR